jgi:hypothetical protein
MPTFVNHKQAKIIVLVAVTTITALFHFFIPTEQHTGTCCISRFGNSTPSPVVAGLVRPQGSVYALPQ